MTRITTATSTAAPRPATARTTERSAALEPLRLLLELGDEPGDSAGGEHALVLGAFQGEIADAVGHDVDDAPVLAVALEQILQRDVGLAFALDGGLHLHAAIRIRCARFNGAKR